mmetsp:Transcript_21875/g.60728  ORF Transcript_21875/g.60728 Transcript_21875/m.60728 type:complete len:208 (-) Transcript_21875:1071-1694(-)
MQEDIICVSEVDAIHEVVSIEVEMVELAAATGEHLPAAAGAVEVPAVARARWHTHHAIAAGRATRHGGGRRRRVLARPPHCPHHLQLPGLMQSQHDVALEDHLPHGVLAGLALVKVGVRALLLLHCAARVHPIHSDLFAHVHGHDDRVHEGGGLRVDVDLEVEGALDALPHAVHEGLDQGEEVAAEEDHRGVGVDVAQLEEGGLRGV